MSFVTALQQPSRGSSVAVRNLSVGAYGNGMTLWFYRHAGLIADCGAAGFIDDAADLLQPGDAVMISASDGVGMRAVVRGADGRPQLARML